MKRFLFCFLVAIIGGRAYSQISSCAQTLRLAQSTYEQGRLHELPGLLESCLKNTGADGFTKDQKVRAYTLLTLAYIYLEEPEKADESMLSLLRTDPYFVPNPDVDPAEFIGLYKTFRTKPVYRLGAKFSINATQPNVSQFSPISDGTSKYAYKLGISLGFAGEIPVNLPFLKNRTTLNPEVYYSSKSFSNQSDAIQGGSSYSTSSSIESQSWISVPILLQYQLRKSNELKKSAKFIDKINPFISLGVSVDYLLGAKSDVTQKRVDNQSIDVRSETVTFQREKINLSAMVAGGVKIRFAGGYLTGEVRYAYGLTKINSPSTLYSNQIVLNDYKLIDGIFNLNSLFVNVGYVQNFFNPKKLKRR